MRHRSTHRSAAACAGFTLMLLPAVATTAGGTATLDPVVPRARAAAAVAEADLDWSLASRSGARTAETAPAARPVRARTGGAGVTAGDVRVSGPKGTRVWTASAMADHGLPLAAARAYRSAARQTAVTDPACQLPWTLLAGIGRVESDHGRYGGSRLGADGVSRPLIIGVQLNGAGPVAAIRDTDDGRYDGDRVWDRAVGPMQFIPSTWDGAARDGDGDGRRSPNDLDDAALAAAGYLCSGSGSVLGETAMAAAIYRYNQDDYYVALVMAFERGYRTGVFVMPPPPVEEEPVRADGKRGRDRDRKQVAAAASKATKSGGGATTGQAGSKSGQKSGQDGGGDGGGTSTGGTGPAPAPEPDEPAPSPKPTPKPSPTPAPSPEPEPEPAGPEEVKGVFQACSGGYCLGNLAVALGAAADLDAPASGDYNGDGATGTNGEELTPLLGTSVTMVVEKQASGPAVVHSINGVALG
ncbi:lytic murein transglycosylase [Nocardioides jiangsuensis]|uniref:lytic murein transglycosylase n=1 Tax=Nocardioides jiangsuensis TaxID=2866161 RepID=UPI001CED11E4|nr:lytic murein transglycosylase [Nocardioides jiangsuensis]